MQMFRIHTSNNRFDMILKMEFNNDEQKTMSNIAKNPTLIAKYATAGTTTYVIVN